MSYIGVEPVAKASWRFREGIIPSDTSTVSVLGGYQIGYFNVYIEGRRLNDGEFDASDGSNVTFTETLPAGTNYAFEMIEPFTSADHYTKTEIDEYFGLFIQVNNSVTGAVTEDPNQGKYLRLTLTGDATLTLLSLTDSDIAHDMTVEVSQDATGGHTLTWDSSNILFPGGMVPYVSSSANATDIYEFVWNGNSYVFKNYLGDLQ